MTARDRVVFLSAAAASAFVSFLAADVGAVSGDAALGTHPYDSFTPTADCAECHDSFARQHEQAMMSQSFTHHWDEIEYYELAAPHADKEPKVAGVKAGCNGCHAPLAFLAGEIPPRRPAENSRANDGVSCDVCHSITGFEGDVPFNFDYVIAPGDVKQGIRGDRESPDHEIAANPFLKSAEFCGTCHNEKDPFGQWVKATHLEWKESPYAQAGIVCQDCHMPPAESATVEDGEPRPDARQHLFHGAHDPGKLAGAVEVRVQPATREAKKGDTQTVTAVVVNAKAGHSIPSGSAEERVVWLHVTATDSKGRTWHLPVNPKGFEGEDFTIASAEARAYQDLGEIQGLANFAGLPRDGEVPAGDRIFRLPYLDPKGRMTIAQWNTASFGPDYRLAPLAAVNETFTWKLPADLASGPVQVRAEVWYSRLVSSVGEHLGVPAE
ncbi:MAG: NapC/NirT family cytochrome c, partial [Gemmatimonadetes bacterium]|nr:NapC/NirT family cytochrome c [Gemmatimonadota bacterium]